MYFKSNVLEISIIWKPYNAFLGQLQIINVLLMKSKPVMRLMTLMMSGGVFPRLTAGRVSR